MKIGDRFYNRHRWYKVVDIHDEEDDRYYVVLAEEDPHVSEEPFLVRKIEYSSLSVAPSTGVGSA